MSDDNVVFLPADGDLLDLLERELHDAREQLERQADRTEALAEVRELALALVESHPGVRLRPEDLWAAQRTELERARLRALVDRVVTDG